MAADPIIYCLENITDYSEFERLSNDLMIKEGYTSLEPLGGFKDKGRDAVYVNSSGEQTIFAYSVREDWQAKLLEDADKINKHGHSCSKIIFLTTALFTAGERDNAIKSISEKYKWRLDLYGVERLRLLIENQYPELKIKHPQIFPPQFLNIVPKSGKTELYISFSSDDKVLAEWITKKLTSEGYQVWCELFNLKGGEEYSNTVDDAIKNRSFRMIALYSKASLKNPEVARQRSLAIDIGNENKEAFVIPINVDGINNSQLDQHTKKLSFITFEDNWATGLKSLLDLLESINTPKPLFNGKVIASRELNDIDVVSDKSEILISNCLLVEKIPEVLNRFTFVQNIPFHLIENFSLDWAFKQIGASYLSFTYPPQRIQNDYGIEGRASLSWKSVPKIEKLPSKKIVAELLKKSLIIKCIQKGLVYDDSSGLVYFPKGLVQNDKLKYKNFSEKRSYVNVVGQRGYWKLGKTEKYIYYLSPTFKVNQSFDHQFVIVINVRIRLTDSKGDILPPRTSLSRRKHLCKDWWNDDWLNRLLAICQFLSEGKKITLGEDRAEQIIIQSSPIQVKSPKSIDESMLKSSIFNREIYEYEEDDDLDSGEIIKD